MIHVAQPGDQLRTYSSRWELQGIIKYRISIKSSDNWARSNKMAVGTLPRFRLSIRGNERLSSSSCKRRNNNVSQFHDRSVLTQVIRHVHANNASSSRYWFIDRNRVHEVAIKSCIMARYTGNSRHNLDPMMNEQMPGIFSQPRHTAGPGGWYCEGCMPL